MNSRQRGFTLIEMMVSLVIGLVIIAGAIQLFVLTRQNYAHVVHLSDRQEALRFVSDVLSLDIRTASDLSVDPQLTLEDGSSVADHMNCETAAALDSPPTSSPSAVPGVAEGEQRTLYLRFDDARRSDPYCDDATYPHLLQSRYFSIEENDRWRLASCQICWDGTPDPSSANTLATPLYTLQQRIEADFRLPPPTAGVVDITLIVPPAEARMDEPAAMRTYNVKVVSRADMVARLGLTQSASD